MTHFYFYIFEHFYIINSLFSLNTLDSLSGARIKPTLLSRQPGFNNGLDSGMIN